MRPEESEVEAMAEPPVPEDVCDVVVLPTLEPAKSKKPAEDGGFPSGHTAEAWRDALAKQAREKNTT